MSGLPSASPATHPRALDPAGVEAVDALLLQRLHDEAEVLLDVSPDLAPVVASVRELMSGGKRLRAVFCLWGARAAGGDRAFDTPGAHEAAAALEMFHLAALVHDDVMDHSDVRRGRPTVHRGFADRHSLSGAAGAADDFGAAVAVLVGDLCLTWSDDLLDAATTARPATAAGTREVWRQMRNQVLAGQYLDVLAQSRRTASVTTAQQVLRYKSAKYTVEHPLLLGGTLAGASEELLACYRDFGLRVGEAFQLRDDVLGVFGDPAVTGKPATDDVREGKRTLLVALAEEAATPAQTRVLRRHLGDPALGEPGLHDVRQVLQETGALADVEERIARLADDALAALDAMPIDPRSREALTVLTDACARRDA
jgi:geranylgeranyl diphosphate synthase type I